MVLSENQDCCLIPASVCEKTDCTQIAIYLLVIPNYDDGMFLIEG